MVCGRFEAKLGRSCRDGVICGSDCRGTRVVATPESGIVVLIAILVTCASPATAAAQVSAPALDPDSPTSNVISIGASVGSPYTRDAVFWGLSGDYTRVLTARWSVSASLTYDQEHDRPESGPAKRVNTLSAVGTINYTVLRGVTLTTGLGQGFLDDDNADRELRFTRGDLSTGIAAGIKLPGRWGLSVAWEWNLTQKEPMVSTDLTYGWSF